MEPGVAFEYYASLSGLKPKSVFTKEQHQFVFFQRASGLSDLLAIGNHQLAVWRGQSGLPATATDAEHFNAYYANVAAQIGAAWGQAVKDDALNSVVAGGKTNMIVNPSFERVVSGTADVRRNYMLRSLPAGNSTISTGWGSVNGSTTSLELAGLRVICVAGGIQDSGANFRGAVATGGQLSYSQYTVSMDVTGVVDSGWRISVQGAWVGGSLNSTAVNVPAGETRRLSYTFRTTGEIGGAVYLLRTNAAVASEAIISNVLWESQPGPLPYFDGSTLDNTGIAYSWEGTPFSSVSVARTATLDLFRNLIQDPKAVGVSTAAWETNAGATATAAYITDFPTLRSGYRLTRLQDNSGLRFGIRTHVALASNTEYTVSFMVRASETISNVSLNLRPNTTSSTNQTSINGITFPAGLSQQTFTMTTSAAAYTANGGPTIVWANSSVNSTIDISGVVMVAGPYAPPYFDGDISFDEDLATTWVSGANNSASIIRYSRPGGWTRSAANLAFIYSFKNVRNGRTSMRLYSTSAAGNSNALVRPTVTFEAGKTYTFSGWVYFTSFPQNSNTRILSLRNSSSAVITNVAIPNLARTWQQVVLTFTATSSSDYLRFDNREGWGGVEVYWDETIIVEGDQVPEYFDGNMPGVLWTGTPNDSTSVKMAL